MCIRDSSSSRPPSKLESLSPGESYQYQYQTQSPYQYQYQIYQKKRKQEPSRDSKVAYSAQQTWALRGSSTRADWLTGWHTICTGTGTGTTGTGGTGKLQIYL